jgi:hypothetical protein
MVQARVEEVSLFFVCVADDVESGHCSESFDAYYPTIPLFYLKIFEALTFL